MLCRLLKAITGLNTLSSKCPLEPPTETATALPITCAQTIVRASDCVGLTLPGMMEEPGSLAGRTSSPEAGARARAEHAHVVGDLHQRDGDRVEHAGQFDLRVVGGKRLELVRRGDEGQSGEVGDLVGDFGRVVRM